MPIRCTLLVFAALPLLLVPLGCATQLDDGAEPIEARDGGGPLDARRIELALDAEHASPEQIHALAEHFEGQADVADAKVEVRMAGDGGGAEVEVVLWGHDLPPDEVLIAELQAELPFLAGSSILVSAVDLADEPAPHEDEPLDPDQLRREVIDDLRAKGVEGEIDVVITDHPDGRREVEVEVHDDE